MPSAKRTTMWCATALVFLGASCPVTWAKTWTVGKLNVPCNGNADFTTIAGAISAAAVGDEIQVCPGLYAEQLTITKPLSLRGMSIQGVGRVLIQPNQLLPVAGLGAAAVITVMNTANVDISNLAIDASHNTLSGCDVSLAGIHLYNASGVIDSNAISGTQLHNPLSCITLFPGNGFGIQADEASGAAKPFSITVRNTSIHDFGRNGILVSGSTEIADITGSSISGLGPASGVNQFGIFLANGVTGQVSGNLITEGTCGSVDILSCFDIRSEGIVLRSVGPGVVVEGNTITNVQAGIFVNGANNPRIINNVIGNVDALSGIHIQASVSGLYLGNRVSHVGPFTTDTSSDEEGCGINSVSGAANSANIIQDNSINDAYCGVAFTTSDLVFTNAYRNTLIETLNGDDYPNSFPSPLEPGVLASSVPAVVLNRLRKVAQ